jgi:hypothetical protein
MRFYLLELLVHAGLENFCYVFAIIAPFVIRIMFGREDYNYFSCAREYM